MDPGIYILVIAGNADTLTIGSLGEVSFLTGFYCYVGSALGPGGLARVSRHIRLADKRDKKPRWHVDHLLIHPGFRLVRVYCGKTTERLECTLAREIHLPEIPGFGSSDCTCPGHLFYSPADPAKEVLDAFMRLPLVPVIHVL